MNMIVAVDENWGIGYKGDLLIKISEDMKYFKEKTMNNIVVMGRKTFETLPNKQPLPNRTNIVLTKNPLYNNPDVIVMHDVEAFLAFAKTADKEIFIIGGEKIYDIFIPYVTKVFLTKIFYKFEADKHIPNFVESSHWKLVSESEPLYTVTGVKYQFLIYEKIT